MYVYDTYTFEGGNMYSNLKAEQARHGHTDAWVAEYLNITRTTYSKRKQFGKFNATEIKKLCELYEKTFEYLFEEHATQRS